MSTVEERGALIEVLRRNAKPDGSVPNRLVRPAADQLCLSQKQIRRYIKQGVTERAHFVPADEHIDALYAAAGNLALAYRISIEEGYLLSNKTDPKEGLSERTFRRGFDRVDAAVVAAAKHGWTGFVTRRGYGTKFVPHKGYTYASDSSPLDLLVRDERTGKAIDLWETNLIDEYSRFALVVATTNGAPDTNTVIAVFAAGIGGYDADDGTPLGGMPEHVLTDNGGEYKTKPVTTGLIRCGFKLIVDDDPDNTETDDNGHVIKRKFTEPESGWQNGIDERFHKTVQGGFCAQLPGYVNPNLSEFERLKVRAFWKARPHLLLTRDQVDALLQRWLMVYNFETPHRGLKGELAGMTPFEAWKHDDRALPRPDEKTMRLAMLADDTRIVDKGKVQMFSTHYYAEELGAHHGRRVEVRYLPGRTEHVEIFYAGRRLCRAIREDLLTATYHSNLGTARDKQTETHLAHSLSGERLRTERAIRQLRDLGFAEEDLPQLPDETPAMAAARTRTKEPKPKVASVAETAALAALTAPTIPEDEEFIA